jgi:hypothetical protein
MSLLPDHLMRHGLVLLSTAAALGCRSEGSPTDPGGISLSLSQTSATVSEGESYIVTAALTRLGGFTGPVSFTVTSAQSVVTATVSNVQTSGAVTTATITFLPGAGLPAVYPFVVHGRGNAIGEVTQIFTLTLTVPEPPVVPDPPGFTISLSEAAVSIVRGASAPPITVTTRRSTHRASVGFYMTGLPPGVTAAFDPTDWPASDTTALTLTVGVAAVPGIYILRVHAYDPEQEEEVSVPLTLTITAVPFTLTLSPSTLSIARGAAATTTVNVSRNDFAGSVTLYLGWLGEDHDVLPPGVTAAMAPNPVTADGAVLTFTVSAVAVPGAYDLFVGGVISTGWFTYTPLTLTVTVP